MMIIIKKTIIIIIIMIMIILIIIITKYQRSNILAPNRSALVMCQHISNISQRDV